MARSNNRRKTRKEKINDSEVLQKVHTPKDFKPLTEKQKDYFKALRNTPVTIATGFAGTSKTYVASRMAGQMLKAGDIERIIMCRPATSKSKSIGFFKGDKLEKMREWLRPVTEALRDDFCTSEIDYFIKIGAIDFVPMETIKGNSWRNAFIIIDEAEDCTFEELEHILTRIGVRSRLVLAGDVHQTDLPSSGLKKVIDKVLKVGNAYQHITHIDFSEESDIVRSEACKDITMSFHMVKKEGG